MRVANATKPETNTAPVGATDYQSWIQLHPAKRHRIAKAKDGSIEMPVRIVQSKQNPRLKELRKALAHPGRNERGLVAIEGPNLLAEAARSGLRVDTVFAGGDLNAVGYQSEQDIANVEILLVPGDALKSILATENPQPIAALIAPPDWTWSHILGPKNPQPRFSSFSLASRTPETWAPSSAPPTPSEPTASSASLEQ